MAEPPKTPNSIQTKKTRKVVGSKIKTKAPLPSKRRRLQEVLSSAESTHSDHSLKLQGNANQMPRLTKSSKTTNSNTLPVSSGTAFQNPTAGPSGLQIMSRSATTTPNHHHQEAAALSPIRTTNHPGATANLPISTPVMHHGLSGRHNNPSASAQMGSEGNPALLLSREAPAHVPTMMAPVSFFIKSLISKFNKVTNLVIMRPSNWIHSKRINK